MNEPVYRQGFRVAAARLAAEVCASGQRQDFLVYPIVYLYRHHTELALKALIVIACELLGREVRPREMALGSHDLAQLWTVARRLLDAACDDLDQPLPAQDIEGIDSYIEQLHEHDPRGESFRYATLKGKPHIGSLPADLKLINLRNFADAMERLADYLDGVITWFDDMVDLAAAEAQEHAGY
jgi:hypothetical protein